ncbi:MAG: UDP-N-acetylmuramoyl-L-alanyl-D-glutamate--2,6-diaminopimelate ligase [Clostridiales bacterium]|nr:UDP-N-acetylmuramoyl-L-alanyl-D-glutamate--2,6-diaminopimelate ligase [Clostridiales bacterium]
MAGLARLLNGTTVVSARISSTDFDYGALRTNSFDVLDGDVFICIKGGKNDGHDFICIAHERGAGLIICERVTDYLSEHTELDYVLVENSRLAAANMWNELCGRPSDKLTLVAVTGTNGKTSTTYFLREIFKAAGYKTGIVGTVKCLVGDETEIISEAPDSHVNSMTTPAPERLYPELAHMVDEGVEIVFIEASSHSLSQYRLDPLHFAVGIFTNLTPEHLDYHGTMDDYFNAKKRLLDLCRVAVVNADDKYFSSLIPLKRLPMVSYSLLGENGTEYGADADFIARNQCCMIDGGISYDLCEQGGDYHITCPISGEFTISNTLAAISAARLFRIKPDVIASALADCPQVPGRMERVDSPKPIDFEVYIDYAHTPDALEKAMLALKPHKRPGGRLCVLFGCGGDRDKSKRPLMGAAATSIADFTLITGDNSRSENPRSIICDILRGIDKTAEYKVIERRDDAIRYMISQARSGDVILLAGKGHEDYEIDSNGKHPFSEKDIVYKAIENIKLK